MAKKIDYASMYTLRKDGRYQGYYTDQDNVRHAVCDRDPEKLYHKILEKSTPEEEKPITFRQVAEAWEKVHREEIEIRTWKNYEPHYQKILDKYGDIPFIQFQTQTVVKELELARREGYSKTVVRSIRSIYSMIFDYAVVYDIVKHNPVSRVKLPKGLKSGKRRSPSNEQFRIIFQSVDKPFGFYALFLLCTGCRKSEALALSKSDIDWKENVIHITKAVDFTVPSRPKIKTTKTENGLREIVILPIFRPYLEEYISKLNSELLFPCPSSNRGGPGGGIMTGRSYENAWDKYAAATGIGDITSHNLRHGTATLMLEAKVNVHAAAKSLGHSVQVMQEIYAELRRDFEQENIDLLNEKIAEVIAE